MLFYGCDIARESSSVVDQIAAWTGADVAASTDLTGNNGGNWDLEYATGTIEAAVVSVVGYNHHLDTYDVTEITDDCSGTNIGTLSWAITESNNTPGVSDTIDFMLNSGTSVTLTGTLPTITDTVTIDGNDIVSASDVTVKVVTPGSTTTRIFKIDASGKTVTIENMTINGGDISGNGATDNGRGGAILVLNGSLVLQDVVISGSKAYDGGGIYAYGSGVTMTNCTVSSCIATNQGGGIYSYANVIMTRSTVSNNTAGSMGGGMVISYVSLTMFSSTVSNNTSSQYYGGIYFFSSTSRIVSSTITGNSASSTGAGIHMNGSTLYLANSIVAYNYLGSSYTDISTMGACTVYGNYNILGYDLTSTGSGNVYYTYSAGMGSTLFASYTTITAGSRYQPVLANNGGDTYTVALAVSGSIASKTGCMIGTYLDGSTTKYAFSIDGFVTWKTIENASTVVGVTPVTTDQRSLPRTGPDIGAYAVSYYYYRTATAASGNWSTAANWERSLDNATWVPAAAAPSATNSTGIQIRSDASITVDSSFSITLVIVSAGGTLSIASGQTLTLTNATGTDLTANGDISVDGTLVINSGAYVDSGGSFTSTGTISFNDASSSSDNGTLTIAAASPTLGTLVAGYGTITYDGAAQSVASATYYNLTLAGSGTKTAAGNITVGSTLTVNSGITFAAGTRTIAVTGTSDINGTLTISTGTFDANGTFDATGGAVTFTGAGNLYLGSTVTSLGTFTCSTSTVTYDGGAQSVASASYYNLTFNGAGNKTLAGGIGIANTFTITAGTFVHNGQTVTYNGGDQTVLALNYSGLSFAGSTSGSTKTFANGTTSIGSHIELNDTITLTGSSASAVTVQVTTPGSGGTASRVFYVNASGKTVTIENMTIKGGDVSVNGYSTAGFGGGIYAVGTLELDSVVVSGSKAYRGGGIYADTSTITISNSTITGNSATETGGGIYDTDGTVTISNSSISGNSAMHGGGIYASSTSGPFTITNSTISGNSATESAGGISVGGNLVSSTTLILTNSTISGNSAVYGGGICAGNISIITITNSTISGNSAVYCGGIYAGRFDTDNVTLILTNNIVAYNYKSDNSSYSDLGSHPYCTLYLYGNYNISGHDLTSVGTGNVYYTYTNGKGATLFDSYTTILADTIYVPVLADNGGDTYTVALAEDSTIGLAGCRTGTYNSGTDYAYSTDGTNWYKVEDGSVVGVAVTEITTDQRGETRSTLKSSIGAYALPYAYYRSAGDGDWSTAATWQISYNNVDWSAAAVAPNANNSESITIQGAHTVTVTADVSIDQTTVNAGAEINVDGGYTLTIADGTGTDLTSNGTVSVDLTGTLLIGSGAAADINSTFTVNGSLSFDDTSGADNGTLNVSTASITISVLSRGNGTFVYDGADQTVNVLTYYNLTLSGTGTKTAAGITGVANNFTVDSGVTYALAATSITVFGASDINGTLTISTGTFDSDGAFDATGGAVTFTGAGALNLSSTVTSLGTFTGGTGTVTYDGVTAQTIAAATYYNLTLDGSGTTQTAGGTITVTNNLTVNTGATFAVDTNTVTVTGTSDINATLTISTGTFDANGAFDATGGTVTFTGAGNLNLASTVTSLGTFTAGIGTVTYDGAAQTVVATAYYNLTVSGSGTKTVNMATTTISGTGTIGGTAQVQLTATATGTNKIYDGTTDGSASVAVSNIFTNYTVSATYAAATFADKNVAIGINVSVTGISLTGADAGKFTLSSTTASTTANITAKALTVTGITDNKTYDGTTAANLNTAAAALSGVVGGDTVTLDTSSAAVDVYGSKNVGTYTVNVSGLTIGGASAGNYTLTQPTLTNATISAKNLTASVTASDKAYDGTTTATVTLSSADIVGGDTVTFAYTAANFEDKDVGAGLAVTVTGISLGGADGGNYSLTSPTALGAAAITKANLTITADNVNKTYGNSLTGSAGYTAFTSTGLAAGETVGSVTVAFGTGSAASAAAGTYTGQVQISAATGGTISMSNYNLSYANGNIIVTGGSTPSNNTSTTDPVNPMNDGTQLFTDSSWRNSIDFGSSDQEDDFGGNGGNGGNGGFGGDLGNTNYNSSNGEYGIQNGYSYHGPNGEYGIQSFGHYQFENSETLNFSLSNPGEVGALAYNGSTSMLNHEFQLEDIDGIINFDAMTASIEKHPAFKTDLDLLLEAI